MSPRFKRRWISIPRGAKELWWGEQRRGVRVDPARVRRALFADLLAAAWRRKCSRPKPLTNLRGQVGVGRGGAGVAVAVGVGAGVGDAVADGEGDGCADALGDADGDAGALGDAVADGTGDGVTSGIGTILSFGTMLPMRGRSAWGPPNGAFWLGDEITRAAATPATARPTAPSGAASGRLRSGRS